MSGQRQPIELVIANGNKHLTKAEIEERRNSEVRPLTDEIGPPAYLTKKQEIEMNNSALESTMLTYSTKENLRQRNGQAREDMAAIEILTSAQTWIPLKDELPEEGVDVLVCVKLENGD